MKMKMNSHSIWEPTGFLIQAKNTPGYFRFATLNPEASFSQHLTRWERIRVGLWFVFQAAFR